MADDGTAQLIGTCLSDGILPLSLERLDAWAQEAGMHVLITVTAHHPLEPGSVYFDGLVSTASAASSEIKQTVAEQYHRSLIEQGASHLCAYFLHIKRGAGGLSIQDLSRDHSQGLWFV